MDVDPINHVWMISRVYNYNEQLLWGKYDPDTLDFTYGGLKTGQYYGQSGVSLYPYHNSIYDTQNAGTPGTCYGQYDPTTGEPVIDGVIYRSGSSGSGYRLNQFTGNWYEDCDGAPYVIYYGNMASSRVPVYDQHYADPTADRLRRPITDHLLGLGWGTATYGVTTVYNKYQVDPSTGALTHVGQTSIGGGTVTDIKVIDPFLRYAFIRSDTLVNGRWPSDIYTYDSNGDFTFTGRTWAYDANCIDPINKIIFSVDGFNIRAGFYC
jgi:hypothetical protein